MNQLHEKSIFLYDFDRFKYWIRQILNVSKIFIKYTIHIHT